MEDYFVRRRPAGQMDYEEAYWETVVDPDGRSRNRLTERENHLQNIQQELAFLNGLPPGRILDIGCGLGFLLSGLRHGWEKHGVEVSRFAAEHAGQWGRIHIGELKQAGYLDGYFDVVVMYHVIEHTADPVNTVVEVRRILRRGGTLLLATPDFDSGCARRFGEKYRLLHDRTHISLFTNDSMHRFLRDHGFVIDRVEYPFFDTPYFTPENLMRLFDTDKVSPPFYGNFMTFYCHRPDRGRVYQSMMELSSLAARVSDTLEKKIEQAGRLVADCVQRGGKVLVVGAGSSDADARGFVKQLARRMRREKGPVAVLLEVAPSESAASAADDSHRTSHGGIEGLGVPGDILLLVSSGGCLLDFARTARSARARGLKTLALLGEADDGSVVDCDLGVRIPSRNQQRVRELHIAALHAICEIVVLAADGGVVDTIGATHSGE